MHEHRDIEFGSEPGGASAVPGRHLIAAIGIDRYQGWRALSNGVSDARGALALFGRLGFEPATTPLLDGAATGKAIQELVTDDLRMLGPEDSLVLFYAGHGGTRIDRPGGHEVKTGYLIPVDATERAGTWLELDAWLRAVARLPAKHILVILDACHSGIALGPLIKWREPGTWQGEPLATLRTRRSRRIITSALDDQRALDSGPVYGHSLFTGCLIEGLTYGLGAGGRRMTTGSELGLYVQQRVRTYPHSQQTPDFGTFDFDDRGELVIPLVTKRPEAHAPQRLMLATVTPRESRSLGPRRSPRWGLCWGGAAVAVSTLGLVAYSIRLGGSVPQHGAERVGPVELPLGKVSRVQLSAEQRADAPTAICPVDMVHVPGGTFQMGSPDGIGDADEQPRHAVTLSEYCIDKTEVAVKAYAACVVAGGCAAASLTVKWAAYSPESVKLWSRYCNRGDRPDHPMNCVDWYQAAAYCEWVGKRLPTEAEWEYAARGDDGRPYPWGEAPPSGGRLNACGLECTMMAKRDFKGEWGSMYNSHDGWETTAPVGQFPADASPFGVLDMTGNIAEWTADWIGSYELVVSPNPQGPKTGISRVIRGGAWHDLDANFVRSAFRYWADASIRYDFVGFRCAQGRIGRGPQPV